jgi:hypothetical protein
MTTGGIGRQGKNAVGECTPFNFCVKNQYYYDRPLSIIPVVCENSVGQEFQQHAALPSTREVRYHFCMIDAVRVLVGASLRVFRARRVLLHENLAFRQQLAAFKRKHPRPQLDAFDKLFWVLARRFWSRWKQALIVVSPEAVVRWHRSGIALYWCVISKARRMVG